MIIDKFKLFIKWQSFGGKLVLFVRSDKEIELYRRGLFEFKFVVVSVIYGFIVRF
jgi:hypothetical protein